LIVFADSVLTSYWITQVMYNVWLLYFYQSYNTMNNYHLLITHTYATFMKQCRCLACHFPVMHKVFSSHYIFIKPDFILKISGTCIDCYFRKQSIFIKDDSILVSISTKWRISLLSVLPHNWWPHDPSSLLHQLFPVRVIPSFLDSLVSMHLVRLCIVNKRFTFREWIINNEILQLSHSLF